MSAYDKIVVAVAKRLARIAEYNDSIIDGDGSENEKSAFLSPSEVAALDVYFKEQAALAQVVEDIRVAHGRQVANLADLKRSLDRKFWTACLSGVAMGAAMTVLIRIMVG